MSLLPPAYRGAPYRQPRPLSRRHRALRVLVPAGIVAAVLLVLIAVSVLLMHTGVP
jgi:hypothetical protein